MNSTNLQDILLYVALPIGILIIGPIRRIIWKLANMLVQIVTPTGAGVSAIRNFLSAIVFIAILMAISFMISKLIS